MVDELKICTSKTSHSPPVPHGYKECPECGKLLQLQGYGGHMWGIHGIRVGDKARLNKLWDWFNSTTREKDTGILRIPDEVATRFYQVKKQS